MVFSKCTTIELYFVWITGIEPVFMPFQGITKPSQLNPQFKFWCEPYTHVSRNYYYKYLRMSRSPLYT